MCNRYASTKLAHAFAKFRPSFSKEVYETIFDFYKEGSCSFELAVDVGCGCGLTTVPLASRFDRVIGVDVSAEQIAQAPAHVPRLTFRVGAGEDLSFVADDSVDLVTVAQAMHWMDVDKLYGEAERCLKPGGSFVSYGMGMAVFDNKKAQAVFDNFYHGLLRSYWTGRPTLAWNHYRDFSLPFPGWRRNDSLKMETAWSVDHVIGYLSSLSSWNAYLQDYPDSRALDEVRERLMQVYGCSSGEAETEHPVKIQWPVFMLMGHKPGK